MKKSALNKKGFTLIELLVVIVIILILAVIVFVALNPSKRIKDAKDARRTADVATILTAVHLSTVDSKGTLPSGLSTSMPETQIGQATSGCEISSGGCAATPSSCVNLTTSLEKYLKAVPEDPNSGNADKTGYTIMVNANNIVTVRACYSDNTTIVQSR